MNDFNKIKQEDEDRTLLSQNMNYERLAQENITLKADTLIYIEDIKHLSEVNKNLEYELENTRKKVLELLNENDSLQKEVSHKCLETDKLTEAITRLRLFDNPEVEFTIENRKNKDQRIRELEFECKGIAEDRIKLVTENKILQERLSELKAQNDDLVKEINYSKMRETEQFNGLDEKIRKLERQLDDISKENNTLRLADQKNQRDIQTIKNERDIFQSKYQKKKNQLSQLTLKYNELDNQFKRIQFERMTMMNDPMQRDEMKFRKDNGKQKVLSDLYNKIQQFKSQIMNKRTFSP